MDKNLSVFSQIIQALRLFELEPQALLALAVRGRWPQAGSEGLAAHLDDLAGAAWFARETDWSGVEFTPELIELGVSKALDMFLGECNSQIAQQNPDLEAWQLARYLGHRLLSGLALPEEIPAPLEPRNAEGGVQ